MNDLHEALNTLTKQKVASCVQEAGEVGVTKNDLVENVDVTKKYISKLLNEFQESNLIESEQDSEWPYAKVYRWNGPSEPITFSDYRDEDTLRRLYHKEGLSQVDISKKFGCTPATVGYWMDEHGIPVRDRSEAISLGHQTNDAWREEDTLRELYIEKHMTQIEIADIFNISQSTVKYWMDEFGIERRGTREAQLKEVSEE